jgi:putative hydrolase
MGIDPNDPTSLQRALEGPDAFQMEPSTGQQAVLRRLQALVSFTEAWGDTVVRAAAGDKLTALPRIEEAIRRRRAEQGPGERFLAQLVGLDLTPADVRQAQEFCAAVVAARGQEGLDRVWADPAYLPSLEELSEPSRWLVRMAAAELEAGDPDAT